MNIKQQEKEVLSLQKDYDKLSDQTKERKDLAKKLKDDAFAEKYACFFTSSFLGNSVLSCWFFSDSSSNSDPKTGPKIDSKYYS